MNQTREESSKTSAMRTTSKADGEGFAMDFHGVRYPERRAPGRIS